MSEPIIQVENLSKRYRLGQFNARTLREEFQGLFRRKPGNGTAGDGEASPSDFRALKDVSFEVQRGEVLGIIGRNGAGKSTLLKILSRVTEPTSGFARIRGRVASLLEVGTGFHPDLTGRENIYLNGAILGMSRAEIRKKFDEIVDFSGVETFLDTPVKRYSSGMYVRLAFAVAAHLEPEILIVDEVLAVGDAEFQKKCLGRMRSVSSWGGRTVLFVSHNMGAVQSLCSTAIVLEAGHLAYHGDTADAVSFYHRDQISQSEAYLSTARSRVGTGEAQIVSLRLEDDAGNPRNVFRMGEPLNVVVGVEFFKEARNPILGFNIITDTGVTVADCRSTHGDLDTGKIVGMIQFVARIDQIYLYPRRYIIEPWATDSSCVSVYDWVQNTLQFEVTSGSRIRSGANVSSNHGITYIPASWKLKLISTNSAAGLECHEN